MNVTGNGTFAGDVAFTANANFGDSNKAQFGAGNDLQIYHDAPDGNSYIKDAGTGALTIAASTFNVTNAAVSEAMFSAASDGASNMFYNGVKKFETSATGATLTGVLVGDTVSGNPVTTSIASDDLLAVYDTSGSAIKFLLLILAKDATAFLPVAIK